MAKDSDFGKSKNWNELVLRSHKLRRAKQLGFEYPRVDQNKMLEHNSTNVLFVCSMNQWRSPTAEKIYSDKSLICVRSAGTNQNARKTVTSNDLKWADVVFAMEDKHKARLSARFPGETRYKTMHVLDIPDNYKYMDAELIVEIQSAVDPILFRSEK